MLIVGDLSGIQEFVFALPEKEGGQARTSPRLQSRGPMEAGMP